MKGVGTLFVSAAEKERRKQKRGYRVAPNFIVSLYRQVYWFPSRFIGL